MSFSIDILQNKYIDLVSDKLEGFTRKSDRETQFRCPFCGDSLKSKTKKRGWLVRKDLRWFYYCFNCGASYNFSKFLELLDKTLYSEYILEVMQNRDNIISTDDNIKPKENVYLSIVDKYLTPVSELNYSHPAYSYLRKRCIDPENLQYVYYTTEFDKFIHENIKEKYDNVSMPTEGIVFKLYDLEHNIQGFQIRNINATSKANRFMTCAINETHGYFYTAPIDKSKEYIICEGPIDALSISNGIAVLNAALYKFKNTLDISCVYFNDQEPFNKEVDKEIRTCIDRNLSTVLLSKEYFGLDINDIKCKYPDISIEELAKENSYQGLQAKFMYSKWKNQ